MTQVPDDPDHADLERAFKLREEGQYNESISIFRRFALNGDCYAQVQLGDMLDRGLAGKRDGLEARKWLAAAASSGDSYSRLRFARFLEQELEHNNAFNIIRELADGGYSPAVYRLARYLELGIGTEKDAASSRRYLIEAANMGHVRALRMLAIWEIRGQFGFWRIPIGLVRFITNLFYVAALAMRQPDSPNLLN